MEYSISLALYDFLPSIFTAIGLVFVAQMVTQADAANRRLAYVGAVLVVVAGFTKALWKLIMALGGPDILVLREALFPLMGPGFLLVALAIWAAMRRTHGKPSPRYLVPLALVVVFAFCTLALVLTFGAGNPRGYFPVFLMLATISNISIAVMCIRESLTQGKRLAAMLFFVNIGMVFALQPIAAMPDKSIAIHWFEQTLTVGGAAAFAYAAFLLMRALRPESNQGPLTNFEPAASHAI